MIVARISLMSIKTFWVIPPSLTTKGTFTSRFPQGWIWTASDVFIIVIDDDAIALVVGMTNFNMLDHVHKIDWQETILTRNRSLGALICYMGSQIKSEKWFLEGRNKLYEVKLNPIATLLYCKMILVLFLSLPICPQYCLVLCMFLHYGIRTLLLRCKKHILKRVNILGLYFVLYQEHKKSSPWQFCVAS